MTFAKRFQSNGEPSEFDPSSLLDNNLSDGVVVDKSYLTTYEPDARHNQGRLDEDDAFLGMAAPEVWEYEVEEGRSGDFEEAVRNSQVVMEFEVIDDANAPA